MSMIPEPSPLPSLAARPGFTGMAALHAQALTPAFAGNVRPDQGE
jgi:hypothetical protein